MTARGVLACVVGLAGIVVGVGIGIPHAVRTGLTLTSVVGMASLVAGGTLMVIGARGLLRGRRWWVAVPVVVGLAVLTGLT